MTIFNHYLQIPDHTLTDGVPPALQMIRDHAATINKAVQAGEQGQINRILRGLVTTRKKLDPKVLELAVHYIYPPVSLYIYLNLYTYNMLSEFYVFLVI